jgi:hypothetical protein
MTVITKKGSHWASEGEVTEVTTASGETTLALTDEAVKIGDLRLVLEQVQADNGKLHEFLHSPLCRRGDRGAGGVRGSMPSNHKQRNAVPGFVERVLDVAWSLPIAFRGAV